MDVINMDADTLTINAAKDKVDRNKQFIKRIGDDIYIDESVKILNKVIEQGNVAKRN